MNPSPPQDASLEGVTVVITRPAHQAGQWIVPLTERGAKVLLFDTIEIGPVTLSPEQVSRMCSFDDLDAVVFTSQNAVQHAVALWQSHGIPLEKIGNLKVIAIGSKTGKSLDDLGLKADLVPKQFNQDGLLSALDPSTINGARVLFPCARRVRPALADNFPRLGAELLPIVLYETRTRPGRVDDEVVLSSLEAGTFITFTSPSTVSGWFDLIGGDRGHLLLSHCVPIALGPTTSKALSDRAVFDHVVAPTATLDGVIEVLCRAGVTP